MGGIASYCDALRVSLKDQGIDVVVDDADEWIPNETGWSVDRAVSKKLQDAAKGFEIVHAFGYRAAWACNEAFYLKRHWVYTAYDLPKTTASQLIDRLNAARTGICVGSAVKHKLDSADALNLRTIVPGVWVPPHRLSKAEARQQLGICDDQTVVLAIGPYGSDRGFSALWDAATQLGQEVSDVMVCALGPVDQDPGHSVRVVAPPFDKWMWLAACDIVVAPYERAGFSMAAAEAMRFGKVVLMRRAGGLPDMGTENVNIELFENDDDLLFCLIELLNSPIHRESVSDSAAIRAESGFDLERCAREHAQLYRDLLTR